MSETHLRTELIEKLANYAHAAWSGWMDYMFGKSQKNKNGTITIPKWAVERWGRQARTEYLNLPEEEKKSDREEAEKMLNIVQKIVLK